MTQYVINIGTIPNDGTGDPLRTAFNETNLNFDQVFAAGPVLSNVRIANNTILTTNTNGNLVLAPNGIGVVQSNVSIVPNTSNIRNLGSATRRWSSLYVQYANISGNLDLAGTFSVGDLTVSGNLTVTGNTIQIGNLITDAKTIQLANTASTANAANGSGMTVGSNDNIATMLYSSATNAWTFNIGLDAPNIVVNNITSDDSTFVTIQDGLDVQGDITAETLSVSGNITGSYFIGNGSQLTGVSNYANANAVAYGAAGWAGNIIPAANVTYSLGNSTNWWSNVWVANNTIYIGGVALGMTAGNVLTVGGNAVLQNGSDSTISTTGNITTGNVLTGGVVSAAGNVRGANFNTVGLISATGNITGNYFVGNGSQLTGLNTTSSNISNGTSNVDIPTANGNVIINTNDTYAWTFATDGATIFPTLTVTRGDTTGTLTGQTLLFGDITQEAIISTLNGNADIPNSQRLVINPGAGADSTFGEGGDIYLYAGRGGNLGGSGGDIKIRGGLGPVDGAGGYITMEGGEADVNGAGGYIEIYGGRSGNSAGGYLDLRGGFGQTTGGYVSIQGGQGQTGTGGDVSIIGGISGNGLPEYGNVNISSGASTWRFDNTGNLALPRGGVVYETNIPFGGLDGNTIALAPSGGTSADQQLLVYPTAGPDANHLHLTSGNLYNTELFLGNDNLYVKLANTGDIVINSNDGAGNTAQWIFGTDSRLTFPGTPRIDTDANNFEVQAAESISLEANAVVNIYTDTSGTAYQWQFGDDGNLTVPGGMLINGNINTLGSQTALLQSIDDLPLSFIASGANGAVTSFWAEDFANLMTSNIAAIYTPLQNTQTVRIVTGSNGGNIAIYDFDKDGMFTAAAVCATGNVYAGNVSASGNVTGNYILGNGSQLTNLPAPTVAQDIASVGAMSIMLYDGNIKYNNYATVEPASGNITGGNILTGGQIISTGAGNAATNGGQIFLNGATLNRIDWNTNGTGAPEYTTRSAGAKVVLYPAISGSATDYALGVEAGALWSGIPGNDGGQFFKWYGGNVPVASLSGTGVFSATGNITGGNILTAGLISATGNITGNNLSLAGNITSNIGFTGATITINNSPGGVEGAEIQWALPAVANTSLSGTFVQDVYANGMRFFESGGNTRGLYMDLGNTPNGSTTAVGYRDIPQVAFTANTTIATTDAGRHYYSTLSTGNVLTIANNASQGFQVGAAISIINQGTGNITVAQGSGVTLYLAGNATSGNRTVATFGMATLIKVATDTWFINGTGVT